MNEEGLQDSWKGQDGDSGSKWVVGHGEKVEWGDNGRSGPSCLAGDQGWRGHGMGKVDLLRFQGIWWLPSGSGTWTGGTGVGQAEAFWSPRTLGFGIYASQGPWLLIPRFTDGAPPPRPWAAGVTASSLPQSSLFVPWGASLSHLSPLPPSHPRSLPQHIAPLRTGGLTSLGSTQGSHGRKTEASRGLLNRACDFYTPPSHPRGAAPPQDGDKETQKTRGCRRHPPCL